MEEKYRIVTVSELADMLREKEYNNSVDFTFDNTLETEPTGWYGVKIVDLFNEPNGCVTMGYYGGGATIARCIDVDEDNIEDLLREMLWELEPTSDDPVEVVCVDMLMNNGK